MPTFLDIYGEGETFREQFARDMDDGAAWFDIDEFARMHDVDGVKVMAVLAMDRRARPVGPRASDGDLAGISRPRGILFVRAQEVGVPQADQPIRLDGRLYTVADARLLQDAIWRIELEANEG
ncbi:MAG: hypothetical protein IJR14_07150 [Synergistaceae bacterium]|nr:hypothetical protein [Synergistaceae bacterium]